jgi:flagellar FliJ protein
MSDTIFSLLVDLAERERNTTSKRLADANAGVTAAKAQLDMLERYLADYQKRLSNRLEVASGAETLRNFNAFILKLESAIVQQKRELAICEMRCRDIVDAERAAQRKLLSFETLRDRRSDEARLLQHVNNRRLEDQAAANSAYRNQHSGC